MAKSLVAFDTDHVKRYVFGTDTLKEIRGGSSLLDYLNRIVMEHLAKDYQAETVYAHGGSGLFLIETQQAEAFGKSVQQAYRDETGGGASLTFVWQPLPEHVQSISNDDIKETLDRLQWQLLEEKLHPPEVLTLTTHPFLRPCDACGLEYADASSKSETVSRDSDEEGEQFCASCQRKRFRDHKVKNFVIQIMAGESVSDKESLWSRIIPLLSQMDYDLSQQPERPTDFNIFSDFKGAKDYLGLIYADANNMGSHLAKTRSLLARKTLAERIDRTLDEAVCAAITQHLQVAEQIKPREQWKHKHESPPFPFDILLLGGDDICMVVPASVAMDIALTMANTFRDKMQGEQTLSVSVVLAPVKYPFGLLQDMAETSLKFAKQKGADTRVAAQEGTTVDDTRINFLVVTGSSSNDFKDVYESTYHMGYKADYTKEGQDFYATLRPYTPVHLRQLLNAIRSKDGANLGRTKLHQMREAILQMNITTSVSESLAILINWREKQRNHVMRSIYSFATQYQEEHGNLADPVAGFPRVIFPWFKDGQNSKNGSQIYRTHLLDLIELYDFLSREGGETSDEV